MHTDDLHPSTVAPSKRIFLMSAIELALIRYNINQCDPFKHTKHILKLKVDSRIFQHGIEHSCAALVLKAIVYTASQR